MANTNRGDTFTHKISLARVGDAFTLPTAGTVSSTSKPGIDPMAIWKAHAGTADAVTDACWTLLPNITNYKSDGSGDEKENRISDYAGGTVVEDMFLINRKEEYTATCNQMSPLLFEIIHKTAALTDASTTYTSGQYPTKYFIVHHEVWSRRLQQVVMSEEYYAALSCDSSEDDYTEYGTFEVKIKKLDSTIAREAMIPAGSTVSAGSGQIVKLASGAIDASSLVYVTSATEVATAGESNLPLGVAPQAATSGAQVVVSLLNGGVSVLNMNASEAIDAGELVYAAADGEVQDLPEVNGTYYVVGQALTSTTGAGAITVAPLSPYPVTVTV